MWKSTPYSFFITASVPQTLSIFCNRRIHKDVFVDIPIRMEFNVQLTLSQATELVPVGRSKLDQDAADGVISTDIFPKTGYSQRK